MKKAITLIFACIICMTLASPSFAYNYDFSSGEDTLPGFSKSTSTGTSDESFTLWDENGSIVSHIPLSGNTRRNKDAAFLPPPYFYGSGDIPTDPASLYHDNLPGMAVSGFGCTNSSIDYKASDSIAGSATGGSVTVNPPPVSSFEIPPPIVATVVSSVTPNIQANTEPLYYSDGSIGTIFIARIGKTIKVYEGEQLSNLKKGAGHFTTTSAWDGNVGLCGHNRGSSAYFSFVKDMKIGDRVIYTTRYGSRTYEVFSKDQIGERDYTKLGWSAENLLTLITCIANTPPLRWAVQLHEVL